jgi:protein-disulfide isomerase-like protein with CxxC motif
MTVVHISYYTDPACPWSWAPEPAVSRLAREYAQSVRFDYVMCGMAAEIRDPVTLG